ncbi:hypothetical protein B0H66DRAFT_620198, partial [Apodospora peruviana]
LTRSRSLRKPVNNNNNGGPDIGSSAGSTSPSRNDSPSRLPVKGLLPSVIARRSATATTTLTSRAENSGDALTSTSTSRPQRTASIRGQQPLPTHQRPASSSGSMARPTTSSGLPGGSGSSRPLVTRAGGGTSGHARTKSSITTLSGATILRPPSTSSQSSGTTTAPGVSSSSRQQSSTITSSSSSNNSTNSHQQQHHRPAFTTLQQHYSPAKSLAPKPLTSTFLAPPSPSKLPSNVALSAEVSRLQTELLQLHLLHRDAAAVDRQWRASARSRLGQRFAEAVALDVEVSRLERGVVEKENLAALVGAWGANGDGLEEKIQMLDSVICGLWALGEPGGRYVRVVRRFERWLERVREVSRVRRQFLLGDGSSSGDLLLEDEKTMDLLMGGEQALLEAGWRDECAALVRRLDEWRRMLKGLIIEPANDGTTTNAATDEVSSNSLVRILKACRCLVHDMLAELNLMEQMEREAVAAEMEWVRSVNREEEQIGDDARQQRRESATRAGAIWRAF